MGKSNNKKRGEIQKLSTIENGINTNNYIEFSSGNKKLSILSKNNYLWFIVSIFLAILVAAAVFIYSLKHNFTISKSESEDSAFNRIYDKSFEIGEKDYHLSNSGRLTLGSIREISDLEILSISDVQYVFDDGQTHESGTSVYCKFPGYGVFTIDLSKGDFLVDNERHSISVKIPYPELKTSNIYIQDSSVVCQEYGQNYNVLSNGSIQNGMNRGAQQRKLAIETIRQNIESNESYYHLAEISGKSILEGMIRALNIDIEDLVIIVDYF